MVFPFWTSLFKKEKIHIKNHFLNFTQSKNKYRKKNKNETRIEDYAKCTSSKLWSNFIKLPFKYNIYDVLKNVIGK